MTPPLGIRELSMDQPLGGVWVKPLIVDAIPVSSTRLCRVGRSASKASGVISSTGGADERIETVLATPREALLVGTPPALPMLLHRRSRDAAGAPLEQVRTLHRGDRFSFTLHLGAPTSA